MTRWPILLLCLTGCPGWDPPPGSGPDAPLPAALIGVGVSPHDPKVTVGEPLQFTAIGYFDDQSTRDVTDSVTWLTSAPTVVEVSSSIDQEGAGSAIAVGTARIRARFFDIESNDVKVTVTEATVAELDVAPSSVDLHPGEAVQLQAEAVFSDGSRGNVSGTVRWIVDDPLVATISASGRVEAVAQGGTEIRAQYSSDAGQVEADPVSIQVVGGDVVIDQADVRVVGVSFAVAESTVTWAVDLRNSGGSPASGFWVDAWLNRSASPPPPPANGDTYAYVDLLDAGETTTILMELPDVAPGNYQSWFLADSYASVAEGSLGENNNAFGPTPLAVTGGEGALGPELSVSYLQAYVQASQGRVLYIVDVTNTGGTVAPPFAVGVWGDPGGLPADDSSPDESVTVESLAPGETAYLDLAIRAMPETWWYSYVVVDNRDEVEEVDESNNVEAFQVLP